MPRKKQSSKKTTSTDIVIPSGIGGGRGFEDMDSNDYIIPYAKLLQALSPEIGKNNSEFIQNAASGDIVNSLTKHNYGSSLKFIPIMFQKRRIKWTPRKFGGGIECGSMGAKSPDMGEHHSSLCNLCKYSRWTKDPESGKSIPPECDLVYTFPSLVLGLDEDATQSAIVAVSFTKTSFVAGKELVNLARFAGGDIFSRPYLLTTKEQTNDLGSFYVFKVSIAGTLTKSEYEQAETLWDMLRQMSIKYQDENPNPDAQDDMDIPDDDEVMM